MENKNLVITAIVLFVLLVSMYGVRFIFMSDTNVNESSSKQVLGKNVIKLEFEKTVEEIIQYNYNQRKEPVDVEILDDENVDEIVSETSVVHAVPNVEKKASNILKNNKTNKKTKKETLAEEVPVEEINEQNIPVVEEPVQQPAVEEIPVEQPHVETPQNEVPQVEDLNPEEDIVIEEN